MTTSLYKQLPSQNSVDPQARFVFPFSCILYFHSFPRKNVWISSEPFYIEFEFSPDLSNQRQFLPYIILNSQAQQI